MEEKSKGEKLIRVAFASEENKDLKGMLSYHFGRCPYYVFVDVENGKVKKVETKENPFFNRHEPGVVPNFIAEQKADVIIAGGIGPRAIEWFEKLKMKPITTDPREIKKVLDDYLSGKISKAESCKE